MDCITFDFAGSDFTTTGTDCLLISTKEWLSNLSDVWQSTIDILLDIDGRTALRYDFNASWDEVWELFAKQFLELSNTGIAAILLFRKGCYEVCFDFESSPTDDSVFFSNLEIYSSNQVYVADGAELIIDPIGKDNLEPFALEPGKYELYYHVMRLENLVTLFFKRVNQFTQQQIDKIAIVA